MNTAKKSPKAIVLLAGLLTLAGWFTVMGLGSTAFAQGSGGRRQGPPPEAYTACEDKNEGDTASFESPRGDRVTGTCVQKGDRLVLAPDNPPPDGRNGGGRE